MRWSRGVEGREMEYCCLLVLGGGATCIRLYILASQLLLLLHIHNISFWRLKIVSSSIFYSCCFNSHPAL